MHAINLHPILPVRAEASERSEQVTQLLFGEQFLTGDQKEGFVSISNLADGYTGWVDSRMIDFIDQSTWQQLAAAPKWLSSLPVTEAVSLSDQHVIRLSCGSILPGYNQETRMFGFGERFWSLTSCQPKAPGEPDLKGITETAMQFLHTPYLWGGKGIFGIDCSGFTQIVYSLHGVSIPRDAKDQAMCGTVITSLQEGQAGDLVFFAAEGKGISHVGILLDDNTVIHASGSVRLDKITQDGLVSTPQVTYTKPLVRICRYI